MILDPDLIHLNAEIKTFHCEWSYWITHSDWIQKFGSTEEMDSDSVSRMDKQLHI